MTATLERTLKTAKAARRCCFEMACPYCGDDLFSGGGSIMWTGEDIQTQGDTVTCHGCHKDSKLPGSVKRAARAEL